MAEEEQGLTPGKILLLGLVLIVVAAGTSFLIFNLLIEPGREASTGGNGAEIGPTYDAGEFLVNLDDGQGRRFVRASIVFELEEGDLVREIERRYPQVRDRVIVTLRRKSPEDLWRDNGVVELRQQITEGVNEVLTGGRVTGIYFTDFVVQ